MGGYSDTNVEKTAILLPKIEQNDGFLEILVIISSHGMVVRDVATGGCGRVCKTSSYCGIQAKIM
jgi:hypothetical protein